VCVCVCVCVFVCVCVRVCVEIALTHTRSGGGRREGKAEGSEKRRERAAHARTRARTHLPHPIGQTGDDHLPADAPPKQPRCWSLRRTPHKRPLFLSLLSPSPARPTLVITVLYACIRLPHSPTVAYHALPLSLRQLAQPWPWPLPSSWGPPAFLLQFAPELIPYFLRT
jgi:hypothetical protein